MFRFDSGSSIILLQNKIQIISSNVERFDTATLFSFTLKSSKVTAGYALCCMFVYPCLGMLRHDGIVVRAFASQSVDVGFIPLVES